MQTTSNSKFVTGTFRRELKNRFLCEVQIDNMDVVCYVPSSCHLSNFIQLEGKRVLLVPTQSEKSRTSLALFAVPYKRNYIILNSSMANKAIENSIQRKCFSFLSRRKDIIKEHTVNGYKADLFLPASNTIVEIKSVISVKDSADFPTVYSERAISQLKTIHSMLLKGYNVCFLIVSLHPYLKSIQIDTSTNFYAELVKCLDSGLILKGYTCKLQNDKVLINKEIPVNI